MSNEKGPVFPAVYLSDSSISRVSIRFKIVLTLFVVFASLSLWRCVPHTSVWNIETISIRQNACTQELPLIPSAPRINELEDTYATAAFLNRSAAWLGGAVRIPYVAHSDPNATDS